ncbi:uncharacterized protein LOC143274768 isoform X2 [Babylonia areolata]|uniref:uncharacterized protein LOC143274768 isoform X2 n=1 Tax=Babylonia areolata TaxID=304850 RepID=UPI003FD49C8E
MSSTSAAKTDLKLSTSNLESNHVCNFANKSNTTVLLNVSEDTPFTTVKYSPHLSSKPDIGPWTCAEKLNNNGKQKNKTSCSKTKPLPFLLRQSSREASFSSECYSHVVVDHMETSERESVVPTYQLPTVASRRRRVKKNSADSKSSDVSHPFCDDSLLYVFRHLDDVREYIVDYREQCSVVGGWRRGKTVTVGNGEVAEVRSLRHADKKDRAVARFEPQSTAKEEAPGPSPPDPFPAPSGGRLGTRRTHPTRTHPMLRRRRKTPNTDATTRTIYFTLSEEKAAGNLDLDTGEHCGQNQHVTKPATLKLYTSKKCTLSEVSETQGTNNTQADSNHQRQERSQTQQQQQ